MKQVQFELFNPLNFFKKIIPVFYNFLHDFTSGKLWIIKSVVICTLLSLFISFPSLELFVEHSGRIKDFIRQCDNLTDFWIGNETSNLHFRITQVLIVKLLGGDFRIALFVQFISGIFSFYFLLKLIYNITENRINSLLFVASFAVTVPGISSFINLNGNFDGLAISFIIAAMYIKNIFILPTLIILGSLTDERAFLASGFIVIFNLLDNQLEKFNLKKLLRKEVLSPVIGMIIYLFIRLFLTIKYNLVLEDQLSLSTSVGWKLLDQINIIPFTIWTALEGFLIILIICLYPFWKTKKFLSIIFLINISFILLLAFSVHDVSRGLVYLFPSTVIGIKILFKHLSENEFKNLILTTFCICLLSFNYSGGGKKTIWWHYPFPIQMIRLIIN